MVETSEWDEKLKVLFPHDMFPLQADSGVSIELWNKGLLGRRVFLGQATLDLSDICHPPNSVVTLPLKVRRDMNIKYLLRLYFY